MNPNPRLAFPESLTIFTSGASAMSLGRPFESSSTAEFEQHREEQHAIHITTVHSLESAITHDISVSEQDGSVWFVECGGLALGAMLVVVLSKITKKHPKGRPR